MVLAVEGEGRGVPGRRGADGEYDGGDGGRLRDPGPDSARSHHRAGALLGVKQQVAGKCHLGQLL
jgi:hypothetical protein